MSSTTTGRFVAETRFDAASPNQRRIVQVAKCEECAEEHEFKVNTRARGGMPDAVIIKKLKGLGWEVKRGGRDLTCASCIRGAKGALALHHINRDAANFDAVVLPDEPPAKQEAIRDAMTLSTVLDTGYPSASSLLDAMAATGADVALDAVPLEPVSPPKESTMKEAPATTGPRPPSREEKRTILAKLEEVYAGEDVGYAADWSDGKLAASLSVPEAWVRSLREEFHGENASNEAADKGRRERERALNEIRADIKAIDSKVMTALADAEKSLSSVRDRLARLEAGK